MADVSDVENVLVDTVAAIVYPLGTGQPSIVNRDIRVYRGYPIPKSLDSDLANGVVNINVAAIKGMYRPTTRFETKWQQLPPNPATLTVTVDNVAHTLTIGGTVSTPQSIMTILNGSSYPYVILSGDTLDSIATNIAALIVGATATGEVVTIPPQYDIIARIGTTGTSVKEVKRQEQIFEITTWTSTDDNGYALRDTLCSQIDSQLAELNLITMPDGKFANIHCKNSMAKDGMQKDKLLWRSMHYYVEYATTLTRTDYTITSTTQSITANY